MSLVDEASQSPASSSDKLRHAAGGPDVAGQNIVAMLQQAAERAKENEHLAKAKARRLKESLEQSERRIEDLENQVTAAEQRAVESEDWIVRVCREVQDGWVGAAVKQRS